MSGAGERTLTVVVAGAANLAVAVAKAVAVLLTGSAAMQAEAAHSVADTATEVFLLVAAGPLAEATGGAANGDRVAARRAEVRLRNRFPGVRYVFLDPTPSGHGKLH